MDKVQTFVIPAHPGWAVLIPIWSSAEGENAVCEIDYIDYEPVIAWRVESGLSEDENTVTPICVDGIPTGNTFAFRRPDGELFAQEDRGFLGEDDAKRWFAERRAEKNCRNLSLGLIPFPEE